MAPNGVPSTSNSPTTIQEKPRPAANLKRRDALSLSYDIVEGKFVYKGGREVGVAFPHYASVRTTFSANFTPLRPLIKTRTRQEGHGENIKRDVSPDTPSHYH